MFTSFHTTLSWLIFILLTPASYFLTIPSRGGQFIFNWNCYYLFLKIVAQWLFVMLNFYTEPSPKTSIALHNPAVFFAWVSLVDLPGSRHSSSLKSLLFTVYAGCYSPSSPQFSYLVNNLSSSFLFHPYFSPTISIFCLLFSLPSSSYVSCNFHSSPFPSNSVSYFQIFSIKPFSILPSIFLPITFNDDSLTTFFKATHFILLSTNLLFTNCSLISSLHSYLTLFIFNFSMFSLLIQSSISILNLIFILNITK